MLQLALQSLRARKSGLIGSFVALLLGSAVLSVCGILMESGLRASMPPERYAAADAVVAGRQQARIPGRSAAHKTPVKQALVERVPVRADVAERIAAVKAVDAVIADIGIPAQVIAADGKPLSAAGGALSTAHNWSSTKLGPYRLTSGRAPAGGHQVVLDTALARRAGVAAGDTVSLMTGSTPHVFRVAGVVALEGQPSPRRSVVFFSDKLTEQLAARTGFVDALGVLAAPGISPKELSGAVSDALGDPDLTVYTGDDRGTAEFLDVATTGSTLVALASAVAGNIFLVTVFVVTSTMSLALAHRRRETALLRAVGATPRQIRRMVAAEAVTVALLGGVLGWPLGVAVVHRIRDRLAGHGFVPPDFQPVIGPLPAVGAVVITVLAACTAALVAGRRATRIRPLEALGEAAVERGKLGRARLITAGVLVLGAVALFVTGLAQRGDFATLAGLANSLVLVVVIAAAVLGPLLSRASMRVLGPLLRMSRVTGHLAAANSTTHPRRLAGAVTPLILAVSFAATVVFAQTTAQHASEEQLRAGTVADHVLTAPQGVAPEVADKVRRLDQVEAATGVAKSTVVAVRAGAGKEQLVSLSAQGVDPKTLGRTMDLKPREGSLERLSRTTIAISSVASSWLHWDVGDSVRLRLGDGTPLTPRVVAVYERGMGFADITFEHDLLLAHTTSRLDQLVLVRAAPTAHGIAPALAEVAQRYPGTVVQDRLAIDDQLRQQKANAWVNYLIAGLIIVYTAVTVVNAQVMNTVARRREFAMLRLIGTTPAQVMRMMRWESLAVVLAGVGIGTLTAVPALALVSLALTGSFWPTVPPLVYLLISGGTAVLTMTAALVPARLVLRTDSIAAKE
ncbi:FtsX-like permease family protein [Streptomyces sp. NPDC002265]|uniref:FtsX-like permease family protein n=1 Tax=Streptomyces sp. NPDC002265 TaxID=3154415 RepID=UPI00332D5864